MCWRVRDEHDVAPYEGGAGVDAGTDDRVERGGDVGGGVQNIAPDTTNVRAAAGEGGHGGLELAQSGRDGERHVLPDGDDLHPRANNKGLHPEFRELWRIQRNMRIWRMNPQIPHKVPHKMAEQRPITEADRTKVRAGLVHFIRAVEVARGRQPDMRRIRSAVAAWEVGLFELCAGSRVQYSERYTAKRRLVEAMLHRINPQTV